MKKIIFSLLFIIAIFSPFSFYANAAPGASPAFEQERQADVFADAAGLNKSVTIGQVVGNLIKIALSLLAIIFIVLLVYAGFQWMTAEGNEDKVTKAKETIVRAIIGLVIIIAAYSITYFVFQNVNKAAGGSGSGTQQNQSSSSG